MIQDTVTLVNKALDSEHQRVLFEGANAVMLDIDFGTYPYVTSSNTWSGGTYIDNCRYLHWARSSP